MDYAVWEYGLKNQGRAVYWGHPYCDGLGITLMAYEMVPTGDDNCMTIVWNQTANCIIVTVVVYQRFDGGYELEVRVVGFFLRT